MNVPAVIFIDHISSCLPDCPFWGFQLGMHDRDFSWLNTLIPILQTQLDACVCMTYKGPSATHWLLGTGAVQADRARQSWVWILSLHLKWLTLSKSLHISESLLSYLWNGQLIFPAHGPDIKPKKTSVHKGHNTVPTTANSQQMVEIICSSPLNFKAY